MKNLNCLKESNMKLKNFSWNGKDVITNNLNITKLSS
jgi:hypothetical protein